MTITDELATTKKQHKKLSVLAVNETEKVLLVDWRVYIRGSEKLTVMIRETFPHFNGVCRHLLSITSTRPEESRC